MSIISTDLIRGHTDMIILNVLRQGDSYGYELYKKIIELSDKQYELKEATLYTAFRRLEKEGYIFSYWGDETQGGRRKYYHITESGVRFYENGKKEWNIAKEIIDRLIKGVIISVNEK
ncbi:PadR family transcriptional regulator (plasmid) [Bacillus toyonensis]|uniref:PadR family transcriptional regulator n=1 Tax=Bacillus toyonensis TaxID=155322 RepID=UPI000BF0A9A7|nr:PadR family transcriptional regulator [Bacillus toyonensis]MDF9451234.1 PadR family transcriptional regulator [Bacillus toyonensis]MDG1564640.1 PadR family transcriptional regulator [Bacillus toyonensis]PEO56791.1 PadR family transcriptional regulator [Bacillus toyonensis]PFX78087.1 PadR family transcriptional regulator [Bacillus toyonensis]PFX85685.1 PadR family transcriptional regulator [Bacillus toyonensis]